MTRERSLMAGVGTIVAMALMAGACGDDRGDLEASVLRWEDGAPRYLECTVDIDDDDLALVDQFVDACAAAHPDWSET